MTDPILTTPRSGYGGRGYRFPGRDAPYPGVTTVLKQIHKEGIDQWIADMTAAKAVVSLGELQRRSEEVGYGWLRFFWSRKLEPEGEIDPIREHWRAVRDDRAELGTNIHSHMEYLVPADGFKSVMSEPEIYSAETEQMLEAFQVWYSEHEVVSHLSEFTVLNDTLRYGGTADAHWTIGCAHAGRPCLPDSDLIPVSTLIDVKSSRNTWREHGHQMAALANAEKLMLQVPEDHEGALRAEKTVAGKKVRTWWVERDLPSFDGYALLHIRPDDLDQNGDKISKFCKLKQVHDMEIHWRGFRAARESAEVARLLKDAAKLRGADETEAM